MHYLSVEGGNASALEAATGLSQAPVSMIVVGPSPPPVHGVAVMTMELISALEAIGTQVHHLDTRDPRPVTTLGKLDARNVAFALMHAWQLNRLTAREPDAGVHISVSQVTWGFLRDAVLVCIATRRRRKLFIQLHGSHLAAFYNSSNRLMRWIIKWVLRQAYQAWALTPSLCSQFDGLVEARRVHCVQNVVEDVRPSARAEESGHASEALRLLFLSNVLPEKGCFDLVAALRVAGDQAAGWYIRIVGAMAPSVARQLAQEVADLPFDSSRVQLVGERHGTAKLAEYQWANAFVFPTRQDEGQPLVLLEAMRAGLPIIATHQDGIADTVRHEEEALLFRPYDLAALVDAMKRLGADSTLRRAMGDAGRRRYEHMYQPRRLMADLSQLVAGAK